MAFEENKKEKAIIKKKADTLPGVIIKVICIIYFEISTGQRSALSFNRSFTSMLICL